MEKSRLVRTSKKLTPRRKERRTFAAGSCDHLTSRLPELEINQIALIIVSGDMIEGTITPKLLNPHEPRFDRISPGPCGETADSRRIWPGDSRSRRGSQSPFRRDCIRWRNGLGKCLAYFAQNLPHCLDYQTGGTDVVHAENTGVCLHAGDDAGHRTRIKLPRI